MTTHLATSGNPVRVLVVSAISGARLPPAGFRASCIPAGSACVHVLTTTHRRTQVNQNVGRTDRIIRAAIVAPLAIVIAAVLGVGTTGGIIALVAAAVMLGTAAVGFCPLYRLLGINSCPVASRR
jgi:hypothetical protein